MEKIIYGSLGIALCITGIWTIISAFIPEKYRGQVRFEPAPCYFLSYH